MKCFHCISKFTGCWLVLTQRFVLPTASLNSVCLLLSKPTFFLTYFFLLFPNIISLSKLSFLVYLSKLPVRFVKAAYQTFVKSILHFLQAASVQFLGQLVYVTWHTRASFCCIQTNRLCRGLDTKMLQEHFDNAFAVFRIIVFLIKLLKNIFVGYRRTPCSLGHGSTWNITSAMARSQRRMFQGWLKPLQINSIWHARFNRYSLETFINQN